MNFQMLWCPMRAATRCLSKGTSIQVSGADLSQCQGPWSLASIAFSPHSPCPWTFYFGGLIKDVQSLWESIFPVALVRLCWKKQQEKGLPAWLWLLLCCFSLLIETTGNLVWRQVRRM